MPVDRLMYNYFRAENSVFRRYVESVDREDLLSTSEIAERTGIDTSHIHGLMNRLHKRGIVERVPFMWPDPPEESYLWGKRRWKIWRRSVRAGLKGKPPTRWRFMGLNITPVDELLRLATLDLASKVSLS